MSLQFEELVVDATDPTALGRWWAKVLGWPHEVDADGDVRLVVPPGAGPTWFFVAVPHAKAGKNRLHVDLRPDDQRAEVQRVLALGARRVDIGQGAADFVVLADPEGNEFCILAGRAG